MGVDGKRHAPAAIPPGRRPGTHCIGGWVGPRAGLDGCGKFRPHRDSTPKPSSPERNLSTLTWAKYWTLKTPGEIRGKQL